MYYIYACVCVCVCMLIRMCCNAIQCILIKITDSRLASTSEKNNNHFSGIFLCYLHLPGPVPLPACLACLAVCLSDCLSDPLSDSLSDCQSYLPVLPGAMGLSSKNNSAHSVRKIMDVRPRLIS